MRRSLGFGFLVLAFAQTGISINVVTSKHLLLSMPMFMLLACRFGLSTILLGLLLKFTGTPIRDPQHPQGKMTRSDWGLTILAGLFAAFFFNLFFVWGLQHTTATAAGIVGSTLPAIIALCAVWMLKERLDWTKVLALILAMIGILMINLDHLEPGSALTHSYLGDLLIFVAMFPEAWYSIISRKLAQRVTPLGGSFICNIVGFATLLPCALLTSSFDMSAITAVNCGFVVIAALSSLTFFWAWSWGLTFIPASTAAIFGGVMPIATTLLAICFLGEHLHWYDAVGMLMVLGSIGIGANIYPMLKRARRIAA